MTKGNMGTICAENDRNAGENAIEQHLLTLICDDQFAPPSLKFHESIENEEWNKNIPNISINRSCSNHKHIFKSASKSHSSGTAQLEN